MNIFLVRHGESLANMDHSVCKALPDHSIGLTSRGKDQANIVGEYLTRKVSTYLRNTDSSSISQYSTKTQIRLWSSSYKRARSTATRIALAFRDSPELKGKYDSREDTALREQEFGLFDGHSDKVDESGTSELQRAFPLEWAHYAKCEQLQGRFYARMPLGESRADVALRVKTMFGTIVRDSEKHGIDTHVIVSHGVTIRAFVMQWCHYTPEWFDQAKNPGNCSVTHLSSHGLHLGLVYNGDD